MTDVPKGRFTFRFAAVCFGLSAAWKLLSLQDAVPLFGQVVGGAGAAIYHIVYAALFAGLTVGLWTGNRFGYFVLLATAALYTVDWLQLLFAIDVLAAQVRRELLDIEPLLRIVNMDYLVPALTVTKITRTLTIMIVTIVSCWWGFVGYAYYRRDYFGISKLPRAN